MLWLRYLAGIKFDQATIPVIPKIDYARVETSAIGIQAGTIAKSACIVVKTMQELADKQINILINVAVVTY